MSITALQASKPRASRCMCRSVSLPLDGKLPWISVLEVNRCAQTERPTFRTTIKIMKNTKKPQAPFGTAVPF